jgi:amino acid adenylation domain-containing protein/thioester reductase-like protein
MIAARIHARAIATPDHVAIDGVRRFTYAELDERARATAAHLRAAGATRDDVVVVRSDDRAALVAGMLGALYAGAAFLVLTSDVPPDRAERMMRDANARVVIDDGVIANAPAATFDIARARPADLAYVVFTSGTTGTPKGVLVTHAGLLPMLDAQIDAFALDASARAAWVLSPLFDASVSDVFTALLSGATLVPGTIAAPRALFDWLARERITHVDLPPSILALHEGALPRTLRTIVVGGEPCADHVVDRVARAVRLVNVYGPTEATVCTSLNACRPGEPHRARLGRPLAHVVYRVEDGELLIGGSCLARGYANDPRLDAERFVVHDGARFYRTGDRVRPREDGELEWIGRVDRQVKVGGVRVEPEEIESRLREDARVLDVAIIARPSLCAFVVARGELEPIQAELAVKVPKWLVPPRFVAVESLPRTATGKIDYAALHAQGQPAGEIGDDTAAEICAALGNALGRGPLGPDEDFVRAGGDSLAALAACAAADARGVLLSPETITSARTPRKIAASPDVRGMTTGELDADVGAIARPAWPLRKGTVRSVFVTGATGTLGPALVRALASRDLAVTCLVRACDDATAMKRLVSAHHGDLPRGVRAIAGDVALERFGLGARFEALAKEHGAIVHAAADLRLTATYAALRATNVLGTAHACDFAAAGAMRLHHVSTLSVFASSELARSGRTFSETGELREARVLHGGYAQSKWAAERVVPRGANVIRLGLVLPARSRDLFGAFVRAAARAECLPRDETLAFDVTPLDFAAAAIAYFVVTSDARVRHVANRAPATIADLARVLSVPLVEPARFRARIDDLRASIDPLALASVRALSGAASRAFDLFETTLVDLGAAATLGELERAGVPCPPARDVLPDCVRRALAGDA